MSSAPASPGFITMELAFTREVAVAAEIVDGVTLQRITRGIGVMATGLTRAPIVNAGGLWVWLAEKNRAATAITVISPEGAYDDATRPPLAPPGRCRIELAPTAKYRFPLGATAQRGRLVQRRAANPAPIAGASVQLQWLDDTGWNDAPLASLSDARGDFAVALRLAATAEPTLDTEGALRVRLGVTRGGVTRHSNEMALRQGAVGSLGQPIIWDELLP